MNESPALLIEALQQYASTFQPVVSFNAKLDKLLLLDFTKANTELDEKILGNIDVFSAYVSGKIKDNQSVYGIGGYNERRTVYAGSTLFDEGEASEPRRLHLGIDIWGSAGTTIMAPLNGTIHSFAFNNKFGDYGATIILEHILNGIIFHTLYGHLSLASISNLAEGAAVAAGAPFADFGVPEENGHWPPHLHFQLIINMQGLRGDYPGVCAFSQKAGYLDNCPNPDYVLQMMQYAFRLV